MDRLLQRGRRETGAGFSFIRRGARALWSAGVCLFLCFLYIGQPAAQEIKTVLISKPWTVYITYQQVVKGEVESSVEEDLLTFTEGAVTSAILAAQGYSKDGAAYKVKISPAGDSYIWEAVMLHENQQDIVLIKGELKNDAMTGVIVYQPQDGPVTTCNFTTNPL